MKSQQLPTIGFIGLGNMGGRMAKNLHSWVSAHGV